MQELKLGRECLNEGEFQALLTSLNTNGQYAHQENVLLCLLSSLDKDERMEGIDVIERIRARRLKVESGNGTSSALLIRKFKPQDYKLNPDAETLIDLSLNKPGFEPPFTSKMTESQLAEIVNHPLEPNIPLTTVSVERAVADTSRASSMASTDNSRNGF